MYFETINIKTNILSWTYLWTNVHFYNNNLIQFYYIYDKRGNGRVMALLIGSKLLYPFTTQQLTYKLSWFPLYGENSICSGAFNTLCGLCQRE